MADTFLALTFVQIFGFAFVTNLRLEYHVAVGLGKPDASLHCDLCSEMCEIPPNAQIVYASVQHNEFGERLFYLYRCDCGEWLRFTRECDFHLAWNRIICRIPDLFTQSVAETHLFSTVLAYWLERRGIVALHASAVAIGKRCIGFLSNSGHGKSTLAAAFMQNGFPLQTDDILPVENRMGSILARPGYPTMRLWPDEAQHFIGRYEDLALVHPKATKRRVPVGPEGFGTFSNESKPIACIYLPERRDAKVWGTDIQITSVPSLEAVIELVRFSFVARLVQAAGLQPQRLDFFSKLVQQVPMRRLIYPSGFEHLPRVRDAILADLATIG